MGSGGSSGSSGFAVSSTSISADGSFITAVHISGLCGRGEIKANIAVLSARQQSTGSSRHLISDEDEDEDDPGLSVELSDFENVYQI